MWKAALAGMTGKPGPLGQADEEEWSCLHSPWELLELDSHGFQLRLSLLLAG